MTFDEKIVATAIAVLLLATMAYNGFAANARTNDQARRIDSLSERLSEMAAARQAEQARLSERIRRLEARQGNGTSPIASAPEPSASGATGG